MNQKKALITGAHGFVGRNTARLFSSMGFRVTGIGRGSFAEGEEKEWGITEWHESDVILKSLKALKGPFDVLVHCAGGSSVGPSLKDPLEDFRSTVVTLSEALEWIRLYCQGCSLVYPSSAAVYGVAEKIPINEDSVLKPVSPYGFHKLMAEELCRSYDRNFGVKSTVVRLFSLYGPGIKKQLLWDACRKIELGDVTFWGTGEEVRDWLHVKDAAELLFIASCRASENSPVVNGGTGKGASVMEVLEVVFSSLGKGGRPVFSGVTKPGDPVAYVADISKAKGWGWSPSTGWREGIREFVEWFRKCEK